MEVIKTGFALLVELMHEVEKVECESGRWTILSSREPSHSKHLLPAQQGYTILVDAAAESDIHLMKTVNIANDKFRIVSPGTRTGSAAMTKLDRVSKFLQRGLRKVLAGPLL